MWAPGAPAGRDRRRVGARLRAALAGLQELRGLRAAHQARVRGALATHPQRGAPDPRGARGPELRLEATLAALQEQLSRLRRQDAGLKTHLDQLDQQISELQLDVCRPACEALDSDSRPSSGFYELSDVGSCSLSTSCASVCSDRLSPSLGSWLPVFPPSKARPGMGDWRPRSADESTVPAWRPQLTKEGARPLDRTEDAGQPWEVFRPRPVSTGDLERVLPVDLGLHGTGPDTTSASSCQGIDVPSHALDPTYQCDLVARGGQEVYLYPSPLHAVALQSPLFAPTKETPQPVSQSPPKTPPLSSRSLSGTQAGPAHEPGTAGAYINRLLNLRGQRVPQRGVVGVQVPPRCSTSPSPQQLAGQPSGGGGRPEKPGRTPGEDAHRMAWGRAAGRDGPGQQGPGSPTDSLSSDSPPEDRPKPWGCSVDGEPTVGPSVCAQARQGHGDRGPGRAPLPSAERSHGSPPLPRGPLVRPARDVGDACPVLPASLPQPPAMSVRSRAGDGVPPPGRPPPALPERHWGFHAAPALPPAWDPPHRPHGGGPRRRPVLAREAPGRSCSESTLYPVPLSVPLVVAPQEGYQVASHALFLGEAAPLGAASRRKQRRWRSTVEISARGLPASRPEPDTGAPRPRSVPRKASGPWAQGRPALARQDACARGEAEPWEPSAEGAHQRPSTIAETSEEEEEEDEAASDHTTNCFGDEESSSSDVDCCVQSSSSSPPAGGAGAVCGGLAWPGEAPLPLPKAWRGARPPLPPMPKLCRIKASKALKKKIRRFQPTALKVMTMV
ncbi:dapper homolog 2 [Dipodomys merriami]|uniref:dapper homolog 2 n=1 Tax=Dipodomys merriami TaxID=94247 RepID=UPI0038557173